MDDYGVAYVIQVMVAAMLMLPMSVVLLWLVAELSERAWSQVCKIYEKIERKINNIGT